MSVREGLFCVLKVHTPLCSAYSGVGLWGEHAGQGRQLSTFRAVGPLAVHGFHRRLCCAGDSLKRLSGTDHTGATSPPHPIPSALPQAPHRADTVCSVSKPVGPTCETCGGPLVR